MKKIVCILITLFLGSVSFGALTNLATSIDWTSTEALEEGGKLDLWIDEVENIVDGSVGFTGAYLYVVPQSATPSETDEGRIYYDSDTDLMYFYANGSWTSMGAGTFTGGTITSDITLNNGVDIFSSTTTAHTSSIGVRDVDGAAYVDVLDWTNANTPVIVLGNSVSTFSIASLSGINVSTTGAVTGVSTIATSGAPDFGGSITLQNDETIANTTNSEIAFADSGGEDVILDLDAGTNAVGLKSSSGVDELAMGAVDDLTGVGTIVFDAETGSNITLTADAASEDITINQAGGVDASVHILSAGTAADAITIVSSAGGIDITTTGAAANEDIDISTDASVNITATEAATNAIVLNASTAGGGIDITSQEDIDITTTGASGEDITITNTGGSINITATENDQGAIDIEANGGASERVRLYANQGTGASATTQSDASVQLQSDDGGISLYTTGNVADAVRIETNGGASETITINNLQGTGTGAITIAANAAGGDLNLDSVLGRIEIEAEEDVANALYLIADGGTTTTLQIFNDTGTSVTESAASVQLLSDAGGVGVVSNANLAKAIQLVADGGATESIYIQADQGTAASAATESDAAIQLVADVGGVGIRSGLNNVDAIRLEADGGTSEVIMIHSNQGTSVTEGAASVNLLSDAGGISIHSEANLAKSIQLVADGGATETIYIQADQGTGAGSISLVSDAGGITLSTATATTIGGINQPVVVVTDAASYAVLAANTGKLHIITDLAQNCEIQMPAEAAGLYYKFVYCGATETHDHTIDTESDTNYFVGGVSFIDSDAGAGADELSVVTSDGNSNSELDINNPENGTSVELYCQDGTTWYLTGTVISDTTPAITDQ